MSGWKGHLRNSPADIILDSVLLVAVIASWVPQIHCLRTASSTRGLSPYYLLFNTFFSNAQISSTLMTAAYGYPNGAHPVLEQIGNGDLRGIKAFGGLLGLLQVAAQWACSVVMVTMYATRTAEGTRHGKSIAVQAFLHCTVVVFPAVYVSLPKPAPRGWNGIIIALIEMSNRVVAITFLLLQFYAQYRETRAQHGRSGAFDVFSLKLQVVVTALVTVRLFMRMGKPGWNTSLPTSLWTYYEWRFSAINYAIYTLGAALLSACYAALGDYQDQQSERLPLLA